MSSSDESPEEKDDDPEIVIDGKTQLLTAALQIQYCRNNQSANGWGWVQKAHYQISSFV